MNRDRCKLCKNDHWLDDRGHCHPCTTDEKNFFCSEYDGLVKEGAYCKCTKYNYNCGVEKEYVKDKTKRLKADGCTAHTLSCHASYDDGKGNITWYYHRTRNDCVKCVNMDTHYLKDSST